MPGTLERRDARGKGFESRAASLRARRMARRRRNDQAGGFVWAAQRGVTSALRRCPSMLAQERVEIAVLIVARPGQRRQELRAAPRGLQGKGEGFAQRIRVTAEERANLRLVLA